MTERLTVAALLADDSLQNPCGYESRRGAYVAPRVRYAPLDAKRIEVIRSAIHVISYGVPVPLAALADQRSTRTRFRQLAEAWKKERNTFSSRALEMFMMPAYQQIIGLGPAAVPLLLEELATEPDHWFWALRAITGDDPVQPEHVGIMQGMKSDWLDWGREHHYI